MAKRLFLLFISSIIGVISSPNILMATDSVSINDLSSTKIVKTIPKKEVKKSAPVAKSTPIAKQAPVVVQTASVQTTPANYTVSYYVGSAKEFNKIANNLSYNGLYKYNKMIYGHNTANLLGSLAYRQIGEKITITEGGVAKNYQVKNIVTYQKTADGYLNGNKSLMTDIADSALGYDVALLTCSGTNYGNGDASHRLVIFANRI